MAYSILVLLGYAAAAAMLEVNLVFAAFLAGFGLVGGRSGSERRRFAEPLDAIQKVAFAVFIPMYFAIVGTQLDFGEGFSLGLLLAFMLGSSFLCLASIALATRLAGFRGLEIVNLAVASNARGGPGIVLASVAFEAGIINGAFFTTLVLTAVLTSQFAGWWLGFVLRKGLAAPARGRRRRGPRRRGSRRVGRGTGTGDARAGGPGRARRLDPSRDGVTGSGFYRTTSGAHGSMPTVDGIVQR